MGFGLRMPDSFHASLVSLSSPGVFSWRGRWTEGRSSTNHPSRKQSQDPWRLPEVVGPPTGCRGGWCVVEASQPLLVLGGSLHPTSLHPTRGTEQAWLAWQCPSGKQGPPRPSQAATRATGFSRTGTTGDQRNSVVCPDALGRGRPAKHILAGFQTAKKMALLQLIHLSALRALHPWLCWYGWPSKKKLGVRLLSSHLAFLVPKHALHN